MRSLNKILAVDIGAGTQDILLYDAALNPENCISMILPTPARRFAEMIARSAGDLFISGDPIGGGPVTHALEQHLLKGFRVTMSEEAAYTVRNSLAEVMRYGIDVAPRQPAASTGARTIHLQEFNWTLFREFLSRYDDVDTLDLVAIAVQDHGVPPEGVSNRVFRFSMFKKRLQADSRLESFVYTIRDMPDCLRRMGAVARRAQEQCGCEVVVMDTCFAAILGCLQGAGPSLIVNVGNSHTVAALVNHGRIEGLLEHHTGCLSAERIDQILVRFIRGSISSEEVLEDGGHGAVVPAPGTLKEDQAITVTGPNRNLLRKSTLNVHFAAPHGNMMLTGPFGLIEGACLRYGTVAGPFGFQGRVPAGH